MNAARCLCLALFWVGCAAPSPAGLPRTVAPTAIILQPTVVHHGVLDGRMVMADWVCLAEGRSGSVAIVVEVDAPGVRGRVVVRDRAGEVVAVEALRLGQRDVEIFVTLGIGRMSRCVEIQAAEGLAVYHLRWRHR